MEERFLVSGTRLTIYLPVEVDHHNAEELKREADRLLETENIRCLVFDFGGTGFMDSSGIGMIMGRYKNIRFMGGTVVAAHVSERIRRILTMSGIGKLIDIYDEEPQVF